MQNETTDKNAESSGKKSWLRLIPIPFTVFLTAMFYLQGKAYQAGYLAYFHLDNTQMSISTSDAMWLAYRAWGNGAAHILLTSGDWFLDMLMSILLPATIGCVVLILLLVIEKLRRKAAKPRVSATAIPFKDLSLRRQIAYIAAGLAGYVLAIPGSILVIALLVACSLIVLVEPFGVIGKRDAQDYCQEVPLAALPTIPHLPGFDPNQGVIHQLWCNTDTCAVLQAGAASAVPKSAIARTISPPLSQRLPGKPDTPHPTMCSPEPAPADNKTEDGRK